MADAKQRERQQRGDDFQEEIRRSWPLVKSWRMRIADGRGSSRPGDEIVLLEECNVLAELKRTKGDRFELSFLRPNQISGLLAFHNVLDRNIGVVFVSFLDEASGIDEAYAFMLVDALHYMQEKQRRYITRLEFATHSVRRVPLPRITIDDKPAYDLQGVPMLCKL